MSYPLNATTHNDIDTTLLQLTSTTIVLCSCNVVKTDCAACRYDRIFEEIQAKHKEIAPCAHEGKHHRVDCPLQRDWEAIGSGGRYW
ncbi:hypothetical protein G7K_1773-t1 [Saitoella complicata NRRL Y-17804]|uniref:Uncharacterized protein n=1 Tax=Saitoella complicata (strain BCRC 22490 / CBS 7301 / JCM 7358 / NBRC 10748 / NRRL Y-17804) TaxID=698492 RepID=A0A0E9NDT5_SAICN|nr:hypothetical protein G7K_1773-t1 [Saitoella complicata NRRL Y-17804]